jgi:hypothetical protein
MSHSRRGTIAISGHHEARTSAELLETEITVGLARIHKRVQGAVGGNALLDRVDAPDDRLRSQRCPTA